jgi:hypothetical protein
MKTEIKLGQKVKDVVTGFTGITTEKCEYLYGETPRWGVRGPYDNGGKYPDIVWFYETELEVVEAVEATGKSC